MENVCICDGIQDTRASLGCHRAMVTVVCMVDRSIHLSMRFVQANITMPPPCSPQDLPMWEKFTMRIFRFNLILSMKD